MGRSLLLFFPYVRSGTMLHDDTWELELYEASAKRGPFSAASTLATWRLLQHRPDLRAPPNGLGIL
eukprot:4876957-Amphidinium_carterae.1